MIDLSGRTVRFYLSPEGRRALRGLLPARGSFQALVLSTEEMGPLVWLSAKRPAKAGEFGVPLTLVRWDYIASLTFDWEPGAKSGATIGFTRTQGAS